MNTMTKQSKSLKQATQRLAIAGMLCGALASRPAAAQPPTDEPMTRKNDWVALLDACDTARRAFADGLSRSSPLADEANVQLERYAKRYLDISSRNDHLVIYRYMRGLILYWKGQHDAAKVEFQQCLQRAGDEDECLDKPCVDACQIGTAASYAKRHRVHGWSFNASQKSGPTTKLESHPVDDRTLEQREAIMARRVSVGHFDDVRPSIEAALTGLGPNAQRASVHMSDELVVYLFGNEDVSAAEDMHEELTKLSADLNSWLFINGTEANRPSEPSLLVAYINVGDESFGLTLANALHGQSLDVLGYFEPLDNSVLVLRTSGPTALGTPRHEVVHALLREDFVNVPQWLDEGIAALHEATVKGNGRKPLDNWRLSFLLDKEKKPARDRPKLLGLVDPTCQDWSEQYAPMAGATARYFVWFLLENNQLTTVYQRIRAGDSHVSVFVQVARDIATKRGIEPPGSDEDSFALLEREFERFLVKRAAKSKARPADLSGLETTPTCVPVLEVDFTDHGEPPGLVTQANDVAGAPVSSPPLEHESRGCACNAGGVAEGSGVLGWLSILLCHVARRRGRRLLDR